MTALNGTIVRERLNWDVAREDVREMAPNPLVVAGRGHGRNRTCDIRTNGERCQEKVEYRDEYREMGLCVLHSRAISELPDSMTMMQAMKEQTAVALANMTGEAVSVVRDIMHDDEGTPAAVRLRAAEMVLDRVGFVKGQEITLKSADKNPHEISASDLIQERLNRLAESAENVIALPPPEPPSNES